MEASSACYWGGQLVERVRFADAVQAALDAGIDAFVELGATAGLASCIESVAATQATALAVGHKDQGELRSAYECVAELWSAGLDVHLERLAPRAEPAAIPVTPWRRRRLWIEHRKAAWVSGSSASIADHLTGGRASAPAAMLIDQLLAELGGPQPGLTDVIVGAPLYVDAAGRRRLRVGAVDEDGFVSMLSAVPGDHDTAHLSARAEPQPRRTFDRVDLDAVAARCPTSVDPAQAYALLAASGFEMGPRMQALQAVQVGDRELIARLGTPPGGDRGAWIDPALLDGASHAVAAAFVGGPASSSPYLGFSIGSLAVWRPVNQACVAVIQLKSAEVGASVIRYDILLTDEHGELLAEIRDFAAKRLDSVPDEAPPEPGPHTTVRPVPLDSARPSRRPMSFWPSSIPSATAPAPRETRPSASHAEEYGSVQRDVSSVGAVVHASSVDAASHASSVGRAGLGEASGASAVRAAPTGGWDGERAPPPGAPRASGALVDVEAFLRQAVATRVRRSAATIGLDEPLSHLGLDSLKAVKVVRAAEARYGLALPATFLFEVRTLREAAAEIARRVREGA